MTWLVIIFVVFLALSPLLSMMPSRQQRKLASIRQVAALAGLQVQLQELPGLGSDNPIVACYGMRAGHRRRLDSLGDYVLEDGGWRNLNRRGASLPAQLKQLSITGVSHLRIAADSAWLFWDEQGSEEDIEPIKALLETIIDALAVGASSHSR